MPFDLNQLLQAMAQGGGNGFPAPLANNAYAPQVAQAPPSIGANSLGGVPLANASSLPGRNAPTLGPALGSLPTDPSNSNPYGHWASPASQLPSGDLQIQQSAGQTPGTSGSGLMAILQHLLSGAAGGFSSSMRTPQAMNSQPQAGGGQFPWWLYLNHNSQK